MSCIDEITAAIVAYQVADDGEENREALAALEVCLVDAFAQMVEHRRKLLAANGFRDEATDEEQADAMRRALIFALERLT